MLSLFQATVLLSAAVGQISGAPTASKIYKQDAANALSKLQTWYNSTSGLYNSTGWWNSANLLTTLGDLAALDSSVKSTAKQVLSNSLVQAPKYNLYPRKTVKPDFNILTTYEKRHPVDPNGFINGYYDDEGWWAHTWIQAYDLTGDSRYLQEANDIFEDLEAGDSTPCGGIWWDKNHTYVNAIANELYLSVAAHLANRMSNKEYYLDLALAQWNWFEKTGMINSDYTVNDGLTTDCKNNNGTVWSYNQGVILGGLVELSIATLDSSYIKTANKIATAAIKALTDKNGILHDPCEPNCGADGSTFKGVFPRNLQKLQSAAPNAKFLTFIDANADSIWAYDRTNGNELGVVWSGPFVPPPDPASQGSALDALVAAAAF